MGKVEINIRHSANTNPFEIQTCDDVMMTPLLIILIGDYYDLCWLYTVSITNNYLKITLNQYKFSIRTISSSMLNIVSSKHSTVALEFYSITDSDWNEVLFNLWEFPWNILFIEDFLWNYRGNRRNRVLERGTWAKISKIKKISLAHPRRAVQVLLSPLISKKWKNILKKV